MADLATLRGRRESLAAIRAQGHRVLEDQNGERVEFKSDSELARNIASIDREIQAAALGSLPTTIRFRTSKGL